VQNLDSILKALSSDTLNLEEKIALLEKNKSLFFSEKRVEPLIELLKDFIQEHVKEIKLYHLLSNVYRRNKQYREAEHIFLQSLPIAKEIKPYFYNNLAYISLENNELDKAEQYINQALKANPNNPRFYRVHAMILSKKCHYLKALNEVEKALKITTEQNLIITLGLQKIDILEKTERKHEAKSILDDLNNRYPEDESIEKRVQHFHEANHVEGMNPTLKQNHFIVSMVVDALPLHYYQAELLLYSLEQCAQIQKEHILVQCLNRVDKVFLDFLDKEGYKYRIIEPYLDGKYCNKLQQLEAFKPEDLGSFDGVILLDTDMFALQPFDIPDTHTFSAKIVDGPNPSLAILKNIFKEAEIQIPKVVHSDRIIVNNQTFACNFNGGFYYVPSAIVSELSFEWRKWASWLYDRSNLFANIEQAMHTDQVSMAMAVTSLQLPYHNLPANINTPIQNDKVLTSLKEDQEIILLHYHREVTAFGLLSDQKVNHQKIIAAIERGNAVIAQKRHYQFFEVWKRSITPTIRLKDTKLLDEIEHKIALLRDTLPKKLKIIFHAGTPKTGTTTVQHFLHENYDALLQQGILYPKYNIASPIPKHQWIVKHLKNNEYELFYKHLVNSLKELDDYTHTVIFSTEGTYNHWEDLSVTSKGFFALLKRYFDLSMWIWFREPFSFAKSYYRQNLKNPRLEHIPCYGNDISFDQMLEDDWFTKRFDYLGFLIESENIFTKEKVKVFTYEKNTIPQICTALNIPDTLPLSKNKNIGLSQVSEEILRIINRYPLSVADKKKAVDHVQKIDLILDTYLDKANQEEKSNFLQTLLSTQLPILEKQYGLKWNTSTRLDKVNQNKQLIIAGFHRSGTSMLAQELQSAGLFLGDELVEGNIANADGFFEDKAFFHLHANILKYNHADWQYIGKEALDIPPAYQEEMVKLAQTRDKEHQEWGFKDPRTALFLPQWYQNLSHPFTIVIYRHYRETTRSLLHRASRNILFRPNKVPLRFWREQNLAYEMWLRYNQALLSHIKTNPETTLVISHDAIIHGYPILSTISEKFGFVLDDTVPSSIKTSLLSDNARDVPLEDKTLQKELDDTWHQLQHLSITPAKEKTDPLKDKFEKTITIKQIEVMIQSILDYHSIDTTPPQAHRGEISLENQWALDVIKYLKTNDFISLVREVIISIHDTEMINDFLIRIYYNLQKVDQISKTKETI